jgi:hypothetical protein
MDRRLENAGDSDDHNATQRILFSDVGAGVGASDFGVSEFQLLVSPAPAGPWPSPRARFNSIKLCTLHSVA